MIKLTIATVETGTSQKGKGDYAYDKGVIKKKNGTDKPVFNGGTLKILGPIEAKQDEAAAA